MEKSSKFIIKGNICGSRVRLGRAMQEPPLKQEDLAQKLQFLGYTGFTKAIISRIEQSSRHVIDAELLALAKALDVSIEWLLKETDNPSRKE